MTDLHLNPRRGVFDPSAVSDMVYAFEKAERYLARVRSRPLGEIDRDRVARKILFEARGGETQPDLVWRAAVAKVLLEARAVSVPSAEDLEDVDVECWARPAAERLKLPASAAAMPPAGPHATPRHTNPDATPGAGALPADMVGDEVDPATG